jgi:hypothetical protein
MKMKLHAVIGLAAIVCCQRQLPATSCAKVPPCARVHPGTILFVGTVIDPGLSIGDKAGSDNEVRFQVNEIFEGLPPGTKEIAVVAEGHWLVKGHTYLIDAGKGRDRRIYPNICGASGEITSESVAEVLDFLRERAAGKTTTTLSVKVRDDRQPLSDVNVTIIGPEGPLTSHTGLDGTAIFSHLKPTHYAVGATREHYHRDSEHNSIEGIATVAGTCSTAYVALRSDSDLRGRVVDSNGSPVKALELELVTPPGDPAKEISLDGPFFEATTDENGEFSFDSVSPGHYILGSNIIGLNTSPVPATFYPGQRTRQGAYPIEVKLGQTIENLLFTLPDFGRKRDVQVCVVDEMGQPVVGAGIGTDDFEHPGGNFARLGKDLKADETGCIRALGLTKVAYAANAVWIRPGAPLHEMRISETTIIDPGEEPVRRVLVLH